MSRKLIAVMAASVALVAATPALAATFIFASSTNSSVSGAVNSRQFTSEGINVTATAWSTATTTSSTQVPDLPVSAYLGRYTGGLGVTSSPETGGSNTHTTDNVGRYDFIELVFSTPVKLTAAVLQGYSVNGPADTDAWVSYGTSSAFNTQGLWQGYLDKGVHVASGDSFANTNPGTVWLIGAARKTTDRDDGFKLKSISVTPAIPEPGTWVMMLVGFGAVGAGLRRRALNVEGNRKQMPHTA